MPWPPSDLNKILLTRIDRIGDVMLTTPVFQAMRRAFPEAWIAVMVRPETREIVEGNPFINEVIVYDKKGAENSVFRTIVFSLALRKKNFDAAIHFHPTNRVHWVTALAGIPVRIGYRKKSGWLLTHSMEDFKKEGLKHESLYNFDLLRFLNVNGVGETKLFFPRNEGQQSAFESCAARHGFDPSKPYAVLNPSASCPSKMWPAEKFAALGDKLWELYGFRTVLIGAEADRATSEMVRGLMKSAPYDLTGKFAVGTLGACLKSARLLVSNDSGPVHVAVACGTPVVSIFGRNEPGLGARRWGPLGKRSVVAQKDVGCYFCLAHKCRIGFLCLQVLGVEDVLEAVQELQP